MTDRAERARSVLSVLGPHSGCGKTLFVTRLLRHLPGLGCLKVRPVHGQGDHHRFSERAKGEDYYLEDRGALYGPGADTASYLEAGASQVEILRHRGSGLAQGLAAAMNRFEAPTPIIVESSSAVPLLPHPVAVLLIIRPPPREMKPATRSALPSVTDLLINASDAGEPADTHADDLLREYPTLRPQFIWQVDLLSQPLPEGLLSRLADLLVRR
jgi:hypothetical protein